MGEKLWLAFASLLTILSWWNGRGGLLATYINQNHLEVALLYASIQANTWIAPESQRDKVDLQRLKANQATSP